MESPPTLYDALGSLASCAIVLAEEDGTITVASPGVERLLGRPVADLVGQPVEVLLVLDNRDAHRRARARASADRVDVDPSGPMGRFLAERADGGAVQIQVSARRVQLPSGPGWLVAFARADDDDPLRDRSSQLLSAQRLETLGTLASGVAHDLNNLLTPILGAAETLGSLDLSGESAADVAAIRHAALQGGHLVRQLLLFSRTHASSAEPIDLGDVAQQVTEFLARSSPPEVELRLVRAPSVPAALVDQVQLEQVLMNLVGNAIHATPPAGGRVRVVIDSPAA